MSIALRPTRRQYRLQRALLLELGQSKTYRDEVALLRSTWKRFGPMYWPEAFMPNVHHILQMAEDLAFEIGPVDPSLISYVARLRRLVGDQLRLRHQGQPASWVLMAVHDHVTSGNAPERPIGIPSGEFLIWRESRIEIKVTDDGATITAFDHIDEARESPPLLGDGVLSFQD